MVMSWFHRFGRIVSTNITKMYFTDISDLCFCFASAAILKKNQKSITIISIIVMDNIICGTILFQ